ncbi:MAG: ABC transporter permease subunit [Candidatus Nomurabacteria bacterium]|nr:ABC transporter permease subunit [Candidatus Nomurabacteria bacterium]
MARLVHGFHLTKKRKHKITTFFLLFFILAIIITISISAGDSLGLLIQALCLSLFRLIFAYLISLFVAVLIAISINNSKLGDSLIPIFDLMQNLPSFALIPLFVFYFGYTSLMTIIFAATSILWPILFYVLHALKTADKDQENAARIFGAHGLKKILFFSLPVAFPAIITGSIVGFSIGWEAVIGVEIIGLSTGIGPFLNNDNSSSMHNKTLILGISALLVVVFLINRLVWMPLLKKTQLYAN